MQTAGQIIESRGRAGTQTLVLESRLGKLPEEVRNKFSTADVPQLDRWTVKAVDAPMLDAVITGHDSGLPVPIP